MSDVSCFFSFTLPHQYRELDFLYQAWHCERGPMCPRDFLNRCVFTHRMKSLRFRQAKAVPAQGMCLWSCCKQYHRTCSALSASLPMSRELPSDWLVVQLIGDLTANLCNQSEIGGNICSIQSSHHAGCHQTLQIRSRLIAFWTCVPASTPGDVEAYTPSRHSVRVCVPSPSTVMSVHYYVCRYIFDQDCIVNIL